MRGGEGFRAQPRTLMTPGSTQKRSAGGFGQGGGRASALVHDQFIDHEHTATREVHEVLMVRADVL
jgi:hypothetical protein